MNSDNRKLYLDVYQTDLGIQDEELLNKLIAVSSIRKVKKKEYIVRLDEVQQNIYFLYNGIVRKYVDKSNTQELTDSIIYKKGSPIFSGYSINAIHASSMNIQAITNCTLIRINSMELKHLMEGFPKLKDIYISLLEEALQKHRTIKSMRSLSDVKRCEWFMKNCPELCGNIQKQYIASYLDMTLSSYGKALKKVNDNK